MNVYKIMHSMKILFQAGLFDGLPRFRLAGKSDVPPSPTSSWGEVRLGFGGMPRFRLAGKLDVLPSPTSSWGEVGFGGLPRFRLAGKSDVLPSPTSSWEEVGLGFGGLPLLRTGSSSSPLAFSYRALLCCVKIMGVRPYGA